MADLDFKTVKFNEHGAMVTETETDKGNLDVECHSNQTLLRSSRRSSQLKPMWYQLKELLFLHCYFYIVFG